MKLINSSYEIIEPKSYDLGSVFKHIELCARVCYKSEDKITPDSATKFVDRMIKSGHGAMLEHGTVYLDIPNSAGDYNLVPFFASNPYSRVVIKSLDDRVHNYVTTNFRVIVENFAEEYIPDILQYMCEPTDCHEKRITVKFVMDRIGSQSFCRHRVFSFAQESTRYCNYSKDKFGNEITFIKPCLLDDSKFALYGPYHTVIRDKSPESIFIASLNNAEKDYIDLIELGWKPQEARQVLPNALKTELIMTGFASDWEHFFGLRDDKKAHPDAYKLAHDLHNEFVTRNYTYGETNSEE